MLSVTMNLIDVSGNYPSITDIGHAALIFPYRRSFSSAVVGKLPENDIFTLSLFDELPAQEKELVMKDFEMFLFSTGQSIK